jgi:hypothetical protein
MVVQRRSGVFLDGTMKLEVTSKRFYMRFLPWNLAARYIRVHAVSKHVPVGVQRVQVLFARACDDTHLPRTSTSEDCLIKAIDEKHLDDLGCRHVACLQTKRRPEYSFLDYSVPDFVFPIDDIAEAKWIERAIS